MWGSWSNRAYDLNITSIIYSFASDHIDINGTFEKSGGCYEASGSFHGTIKFSISGKTITPIVTMDEPDIDVDLDWYCWFVPLFGGPQMLIFDVILHKIADDIVVDISTKMLDALSAGFKSIGVGSDMGASFDEVQITPEGLTLNGSSRFKPLGKGRKNP